MVRTFNDAVRDVCRIMQFEHWMRFYFVRERDDALYLEVPAESVKKIEENYPEFMGLVELVANKPLDYETSVANLCQYVVQSLEGKIYKEGMVSRVFDSKEFRIETHLFNVWCQFHEEQLDQAMFDFSQWESMYAEWRESDKVKEYEEQLKEQDVAGPDPSCATPQ